MIRKYKIDLLNKLLSANLNITDPIHANRSIQGNKIIILATFLILKLPAKKMAIAATPSIMNATTLRLARSVIGGIPFDIKYTAIGGPPIDDAPFEAPENIPTQKESNAVFCPL